MLCNAKTIFNGIRIARRLFTCVVLILCILPVTAHAQNQTERITDFKSSIHIQENGELLVTEHINFNVTGATIKHGIFRDFPTTYTDSKGFRYKVRFDVRSVLRDGKPEYYKMEKLSNGSRVRIGDARVIIDPGQHEYTITYITDRQIGFFTDFDELYWNVTGNGWNFQIDKAEAEITFPKALHITATDTTMKWLAYSGAQGATDISNFDSRVAGEGNSAALQINTVRTLGAGEGFTISVAFPKGFVHRPTRRESTLYFLKDNIVIILDVLFVLFLALYYFRAWRKFGDDSESPAVYAEYDAPQGWSPSAIRYHTNMEYDQVCTTASIIQMAITGYLKIDKEKAHYQITKVSHINESRLAEEERVMAIELFKKQETLELLTPAYTTLQSAKATSQKVLRKKIGNTYFTKNREYSARGVLVSIVFLIITLCLGEGFDSYPAFFLTLWLSFWTFGLLFITNRVFAIGWADTVTKRALQFLAVGPFVLGEIFGFVLLRSVSSPVFVAMVVCMAILHGIFWFVLPKRTVLGVQIQSHIEGFKKFLAMTEKDRMNFHNPPKRTPELFEKFLPYALALGVENAWADQFSTVFKELEQSGTTYHPSWYSGAITGGAFDGNFVQNFSSSFSQSVSAAGTPPSSSSGSGGGGFSGGGAGGGGGGGW